MVTLLVSKGEVKSLYGLSEDRETLKFRDGKFCMLS
jgi:hypothetical protein